MKEGPNTPPRSSRPPSPERPWRSCVALQVTSFCSPTRTNLSFHGGPARSRKSPCHPSGSAAEKAKRNGSFFAEFLKPDALKRYIPIIDSMVMQHLETDWNTANNQVKAYPLSKKFTFAVGCKLFMSIDDSEHVARLSEPYARVAAGLLSVPVNFPGTTFSNGIKAANFIRDELTPIIEERRRKLYDEKELAALNLMSHILLSTDENGMSMTKHDIADTVLGALLASHETVAIAMSFVLYYLADHPDVYAKVLKGSWVVSRRDGNPTSTGMRAYVPNDNLKGVSSVEVLVVVFQGLGFNPLSEVVDCHNYKAALSCSRRERAHDVHSPHCEWYGAAQ
ncbi:hypothetical protein RJ639_014894 [Escallonia herrerae]|uniref:Cytochrome P450 n=1 Tax=Escallonia herrerae TaxID=1293975 RepID=A0AA88VGH9_9ASTE|nr:hypothetical protein RJ639_014894 [Escallonia herrerae]